MLALTLLVPTLMVVPATAAVDDDPHWQVFCSVSHNKADDPIVYPGVAGAAHMHSFYGNTSTNANSTTASLMAARSNCGRGMENTDHSGYWVPSLVQGGQYVTSHEQEAFIYYQRVGGSSGPKVQPFPMGLRMIAGDGHATSGTQPLSVVRWGCGGGGGGPQTAYIPTCNESGQPVHASIDFPNCWNGTTLDSADHKSHMAYPNSRGVCPATHPVALPRIHFDLDYPGIKGGSQTTLSSGGQYSMHGDFFAAWDSRVQNALVSECLNTARDCSDITRDGETLYKPAGDDHPIPRINLANFQASSQTLPEPTATATPKATATPTATPHVHGTSTTSPTPTATPTPEPGSVLPATGTAGLVIAALGLAALGYGFYEYRFRRRSLLNALRRVGRSKIS